MWKRFNYGLTTRRLASLGAKVTGIDFASEMINNARKRTNLYQENQELIEYQAELEKSRVDIAEKDEVIEELQREIKIIKELK